MTEQIDDGAELTLYPPDARRVARRALVLGALCYRAHIEEPLQAAEIHSTLVDWLSLVELDDELEADERRILHTPLGLLERNHRVNASWRAEGLGVLAWALGLRELPPHDEQCAAPPIAEALGLLTPAPGVLSAPRLRSVEELFWYGEQIFAVHWRLRQYALDGKPMDFATFARQASFGPLEIDGLPLVEDDLAIRGEPIARSAQWRDVLSITVERHQASKWLLGYASQYSEVGTDA